MNVWIGGQQRDDGRAFAKHLAEFLIAYTDQIVYLYSCFDVNEFSASSFDGVLYRKCLVKSVRDYLDKLRHTLVRWILHQRLEVFCVELSANGLDCSCDFSENTGPSRICFEVRFFQQDISPFRKIYDFPQLMEELKKQLRNILMSVSGAQRSRDVFNSNDDSEAPSVSKRLGLEVKCTLVNDTSVVNRESEHDWVMDDEIRSADRQGKDESIIPTLLDEPICSNVDCSLAKIHFVNLSFS